MGDFVLQPFLKWPGGKRWLVANHSDWLVTAVGKHIEPFLGGAAVFFHLGPQASLLSDANEDLIETYCAIRDDPEGVFERLRRHHGQHCKSYYYWMRSSKPRTSATRAAKFLYLNRTCFNGLYRVNLNGEFNVPIGSKTSVVFPTDDFSATSQLLSQAELVVGDFEKSIECAATGDFIYADPPYTVKHNLNGFVKYNENIFSWADQVRLARVLRDAAARGAHVMVSNADHPSVRELYDDHIWRCQSVSRYSRLASTPEHRRGTTELIVSNYLSAHGAVEEPRG
jgi:DNA adenine methylase